MRYHEHFSCWLWKTLLWSFSKRPRKSGQLITLQIAIFLAWNALIRLSRIKIPFLQEDKNIKAVVSANGLFTVSHKSVAWGGLFTVAHKFLPCGYFKSRLVCSSLQSGKFATRLWGSLGLGKKKSSCKTVTWCWFPNIIDLKKPFKSDSRRKPKQLWKQTSSLKPSHL